MDLLSLTAACNGRSTWIFSDVLQSDNLIEIRSIDGKGVGIVALRPLERGQRILAEVPLARLSRVQWAARAQAEAELARILRPLSRVQRARFDSLSQAARHGSTRSSMGTWLTNALPVNYDDSGSDEAAVFACIARLNHSCSPNCHHEWNATLGVETVHVISPVAAGEELTICYLTPAGRPRTDRQTRLREKFCFDCDCLLCSKTGDELTRSDKAQRASASCRCRRLT